MKQNGNQSLKNVLKYDFCRERGAKDTSVIEAGKMGDGTSKLTVHASPI